MNEYFEKWCCLIIFFNKREELKSVAGNLESEYRNNNHIIQIANTLSCAKHIYHSNAVLEESPMEGKVSLFELDDNNKVLQRLKAFESAFGLGFRKVIMIENDMPNLESKHLEEAFNSLKMIEFCIGSKKFGGFYLLGMNYFEPAIFYHMHLDSPTVVKDCIRDIGKVKGALYKLPVLVPAPEAAETDSLKTHL